ncbi:MAG: hypothetical protein MJ066_00440 [Clostridia bacterium]|nr:hypothetical protein [Clostridia bacterium]
MKFFEDLKKKKKLKDENYLKEYYGKMSIETASDLFNQRVKTYFDCCSEDNPPMVSIFSDLDFQFDNWLKYSPYAPKGIEIFGSRDFILQAIARFGFDVKENPYLAIDYTGVLSPIDYRKGQVLWWFIDKGKLKPLTRDKWLFDSSLYSEDGETNGIKVFSIMLCYDKKFRSDWGIAERKEYESLFKKNDKFLTYKEMATILKGLSTSSPEEEYDEDSEEDYKEENSDKMHKSIIDEEREKWEIKRETMTQCKNCVKKAGCPFFAKRQNCASFEPDKHRHW